jgi:hypothetical protein
MNSRATWKIMRKYYAKILLCGGLGGIPVPEQSPCARDRFTANLTEALSNFTIQI